MKNFVARGDSVTVVSPTDAVVGDLVIIGSIGAGVAVTAAVTGQKVTLSVEGIFELRKASADLLSAGTIAKADTADGVIKLAGTVNIGWILQSAEPGQTTVRVKLCPSV